jgi:hypothetical protein
MRRPERGENASPWGRLRVSAIYGAGFAESRLPALSSRDGLIFARRLAPALTQPRPGDYQTAVACRGRHRPETEGELQ